MSAFHWSAIAFILAALGLVVFMLVVPRLLGGRSPSTQKQEVFESGVVSAGSARIRLSAKFYLVAIFFVIFDLEALYLYAYSVSVREVGWLGFAGAGVFIGILIIGLIYELSLGAMNWSPTDKKQPKPRIEKRPNNFSLASITKFEGISELQTDPTGKVPAQSSGQMNVSNDIEHNQAHLANMDHINTTGRITSVDFTTPVKRSTSDDYDLTDRSDSAIAQIQNSFAPVDSIEASTDLNPSYDISHETSTRNG